MTCLRTTIAMMTVVVALTSCSSAGPPESRPSPSPSPSADPLRGASLLLEVMRGQTGPLLRACSQHTSPTDRACGQTIDKVATAAHGVRLRRDRPDDLRLIRAAADIAAGVHIAWLAGR